jgi:rare lipoprotein A (peptidoglycan hydrolase)
MKRLSWFAWSIIVILTLGFGIWAGHSVTAAYKDTELMDIQAALEAAQVALTELNVEFEQNRVLAHVWTGLCSWYGDRENGRPTASGQIFDMWDLTGASRTIRLGSMIIVENVETGRMVPVLVNDRGPYITGRGLDVSKAVAERLGMLKQGLAKVRVYELVQGRPSVRD